MRLSESQSSIPLPGSNTHGGPEMSNTSFRFIVTCIKTDSCPCEALFLPFFSIVNLHNPSTAGQPPRITLAPSLFLFFSLGFINPSTHYRRSFIMLFNTVAFSALLLGSASATIVHERSLEDGVSALYKRQYQFQPGTQTATGSTCADAFGSGYTTCMSRDLCVIPLHILILSSRP